jgi:seryl-tRNA synthetase
MGLHGEMENSFYLAEDASTEMEQLKAERDELDREVNELHAKNGDLGLELQQTRAELEEVRSQLKTEPHILSKVDVDEALLLLSYAKQFSGEAALTDNEKMLIRAAFNILPHATTSSAVPETAAQAEVRSHLAAGKPSNPSPELPEPADLLNQVKGKLKSKTKITLRDVETILEMLF